MKINKLEIKEKFVKIVCEDKFDKISFKISIDDYLKERYQKDQPLTDEQLDKLQHYHRYYYCLKKCLNRLSRFDYTVKEMNTYLKKYVDLTDEEKNQIISELCSYGYLQDESVAESQFYIDQYHLVGKKNTAWQLKKRGVDENVINDVLSQVDPDQEKQRAVKKGLLILKSCNDKSYKETLFYLKNKLSQQGFTDINSIIEEMAIDYDEEKEKKALDFQFGKIEKKYQKKYKGKSLYNSFYQYLANKGFESSMIIQKLSKEEEENEDK